MKKILQIIFPVLFVLFSYGPGFSIDSGDLQDLTVLTPADLANQLVGAGNVANVTFAGAGMAAGIFTNGLVDGIGMDQGVILTSGDIFNAVGPNTGAKDPGFDNGSPGDADLSNLIAPEVTSNASVLEFDFIAPPHTVTLTFNYVFASDEYSQALSFNDVFGLFVNGQNIALVPGTTNPISINTLNGSATPGLFNDNFPPSPPFNTQYDGFSDVLKTTVKVTPGISSHIKLAIADGSDATYDSAAFVSAGLGDVSNLVTHYYNSILGRGPDAGGLAFWSSEIERIFNLGIDIGEGFQSLARVFFNSLEYAQFGKTDTAFVTDLYLTFLNRAPDPGGLAFWVDQLGQGLTKNMLITQFAISPEFEIFLENRFGTLSTRPENNLVNDFYRGFLNRLPDSGGFDAWLTQMQTAQCTDDEQAVRSLSHQIASAFINSAEYGLRGRDNAGYVEDLYNGILKRGADPGGFANWVNALNTMTREQVLQAFTDSPEFQLRVTEVVIAGCLP